MVLKLLNVCPRWIHIGFSHMNASDTEYLIVSCMCVQANVANILIWFTRYCPEFTCEKGCEDWNQGDTASKHRKMYQPAGQCRPQLYSVTSARSFVPPTSRLDVFQKRQLRVLHAPILLTPDCGIWLFWFLSCFCLFSRSEVCAGCFILRTDVLHSFVLLGATSVKNRLDAFFKLSRADESETCCSVSGPTYGVTCGGIRL